MSMKRNVKGEEWILAFKIDFSKTKENATNCQLLTSVQEGIEGVIMIR